MPPTAKDTIVLDGSRGLETNVSQHSGDPRSFRVFKDLVTDVAGRILKRDGKGPTLGNVAGVEIQALKEYVFVDPVNGVESYHVLGAIDSGQFIYRWNFVTTWVAQTLPFTPTQGGQWGFDVADNSVFAFNGRDKLLIGEQPSFRLASLTRAGTTATATTEVPHTLLTGDSVTITGAVAANYNVTAIITVTGPTTFTYTVTNAGASPDTGSPIVASALTTIRWRIAGVDAPSFAPTYSLTAANAPYSVGLLGSGANATTQGSPTIHGVVPAIWPVAAVPAGFTNGTIVINGNAYTIQLVTTAGNGTTIGPVATLTEGFKEVTADSLPYVIYWGVGDWDDLAPQYRFSYYNPTTGHVSNPSPLVQVTETFQQLRTITITIPGSSENTAAYNNGYTQIQLFRTPKNAGIMVALNEKLANNNTGTAITYVETVAKFVDTFMTDFQAPLLNYPPPVGISSMVFQQGRGWVVHRPSGRVRFTPVSVEVDFGRAIECWPPLYQLEIPAPRAVLTVGGQSSTDSLVVQTARGDYSVDGYSSVTFNPYRLQTRRSGSYLGAATDVDGQLVEFYADNRLMVMRQNVALKIQNRLNLVKASLIEKVRLHWFAANDRNYLLLSVPSGSASTANDYTYVFDLDLAGGPIYEWPFGFSAFATVHDATTKALQLFAGDASGAAYRLFSGNHQDIGANFTPTFTTALFRGDELLSNVKYIKIFVNDPQLTGPVVDERATLWTGVLYINEQGNPSATNGEAVAVTFRQLGYKYQSAQGRELIWTPTTSLRTKGKVCQLTLIFPAADADLSIEQIIIGSDDYQLLGASVSGNPVAGGQQA